MISHSFLILLKYINVETWSYLLGINEEIYHKVIELKRIIRVMLGR